jgi:hypothetical protein
VPEDYIRRGARVEEYIGRIYRKRHCTGQEEYIRRGTGIV